VRRGVGSDGRGKAQWLGVQEGKSAIFVRGVGGGIAFIFRPGGLNGTNCRSQLRKTRQSNVGQRAWAETAGGWRGGFGFTGDVCQIFGRGGFRHSNFETRRTKTIEPPGPRQQRHENQTMDEMVGAQVARGVCMGGRSDLPFLPCCRHG
jgi:hypothetical protein